MIAIRNVHFGKTRRIANEKSFYGEARMFPVNFRVTIYKGADVLNVATGRNMTTLKTNPLKEGKLRVLPVLE